MRLNKITTWPPIVLLLTGSLGFLIVSVFSIEPLFGLMALIGLWTLVLILILHPVSPHFYLSILGLTLIGYAFLGKGFAYFGKPPVFVGEFVLSLGCIAFVLRPNAKILRSPITWLLLLLMFIGSLGTIFHIGDYGIDALRDAVLWGYGLFALLTASFLLRLNKIWEVVFAYQKFIPWLLFWIPIGMVFYHLAIDIIPRWPATDIPVLNPKGGDIAVHLSGALTFLALRLYRLGRREINGVTELKEWFLWSMLLIGCVTIFTGRAAILTVLSTTLLILVIRSSIRWVKPLFLTLLLVTIFFAFDLNIAFRVDRPISTEATVETVKSIFNSTGVEYYDGPRQWRINWWSKILDYTVFGEYFWTGKGYGVNLANDDGFQVIELFHDQLLRSPHNSHLTFLARSGVPGFLAWIALQVVFCIGLFRAYYMAVIAGRHDWAKLNLWVLAYWFAFMVNATFDVFLEGPQGGIWFWCVFGFGIALIEVQRWGYTSPFVSCNTLRGAAQ
jgi:hypothetical protein